LESTSHPAGAVIVEAVCEHVIHISTCVSMYLSSGFPPRESVRLAERARMRSGSVRFGICMCVCVCVCVCAE